MLHIHVLNGPNLNLLGTREPHIYGAETLDDVEQKLAAYGKEHDISFTLRQSNHEGQLIDWLHEARTKADGVIINPGGLTHSSISLADAVAAIAIPVVEVHLSNIFARESFRAHSTISAVATGILTGFGTTGYLMAAHALAALLSRTEKG
ncbi:MULTISPECIES: type II 3-dehydroquinate dehydratase [unclassified Iodidimonas]|uniref:type II 3-dehydroquinate dehydratase n=1 Tax=unclassified Iodidimonas TaxID=2626145 RepID=UPI0024831958|nr:MULTISPECIES: type II 3-dehydroquinate dehydratase [unclassified Iodidimonas]